MNPGRFGSPGREGMVLIDCFLCDRHCVNYRDKVILRQGWPQPPVAFSLWRSSMDMSSSKLWETVKDRKAWQAAVHGFSKSLTWLSVWTTTTRSTIMWIYFKMHFVRCHDGDGAGGVGIQRRYSQPGAKWNEEGCVTCWSFPAGRDTWAERGVDLRLAQ